MNECKLWRSIAKPTCLSRVTFSFIDICVQANKMSKGRLFKAAEEGDTKASIGTIRANGQLQTMHRPPIRLPITIMVTSAYLCIHTIHVYTMTHSHTDTKNLAHTRYFFNPLRTHSTKTHMHTSDLRRTKILHTINCTPTQYSFVVKLSKKKNGTKTKDFYSKRGNWDELRLFCIKLNCTPR